MYILIPFSKYSQYPVVGRISANGIKMLNKLMTFFRNFAFDEGRS